MFWVWKPKFNLANNQTDDVTGMLKTRGWSRRILDSDTI